MTIQPVFFSARAACVAALVVAVATGSSSVIAQAQSGSQSSSSQTGNAAPGTKPIAGPVATVQLAGPAVAKYDNRYEIFGGLNYANGQAGQVLPKHYNMGGGEVLGTYWLTGKLGVAADYRIQAGTSPVLPDGAAYGFNRVLVYQNIFMGGAQYRGPKNRYAAIDLHALAGATHGTFNSAIVNYPGGSPLAACPTETTANQPGNLNVGLYCNGTAFAAAFGGSIDFNYSPRVAIRLQPDLTMEHFGTELREFFSISGGLVYRLGKR